MRADQKGRWRARRTTQHSTLCEKGLVIFFQIFNNLNFCLGDKRAKQGTEPKITDEINDFRFSPFTQAKASLKLL